MHQDEDNPARNEDALGPDPTSQALLRLLPRVGPVIATWRQETYERQQRRAEQLGAAAAEGVGAEEFILQVLADERLTDMFNDAVAAAIATSSEAKIRLLGRILSGGAVAKDEAKIDEAQQLLRIAVDLDPVDLRALRALERWSTANVLTAVAHALDVGAAVAGAITSRLERLNLISVERTASVYDKKDPDDDQVEITEEWTVTATAEALLEILATRSGPPDEKATRPPGARWDGYGEAQALALEDLLRACRSGWLNLRDPRSEVRRALHELQRLGISYEKARVAMRAAGLDRSRLQQLAEWA